MMFDLVARHQPEGEAEARLLAEWRADTGGVNPDVNSLAVHGRWLIPHYNRFLPAEDAVHLRGHALEIGRGYYRPDDDKATAVMRPSKTFNDALASLA
mgnify:CR=1 FL=1